MATLLKNVKRSNPGTKRGNDKEHTVRRSERSKINDYRCRRNVVYRIVSRRPDIYSRQYPLSTPEESILPLEIDGT